MLLNCYCQQLSGQVISGTHLQVVCTHNHTRCDWHTVLLRLLLMLGVSAGATAYVVLTLHHDLAGQLTYLHGSCCSACLRQFALLLTHNGPARDATHGAARRLSPSYFSVLLSVCASCALHSCVRVLARMMCLHCSDEVTWLCVCSAVHIGFEAYCT